MKAYSDYKEVGIRWVNSIPKHWDAKPLFAMMSENKESNKGNIEQNVLSLSYGKIIRRDLSNNFGLLPESFETYQIIYPCYIVLRLTDLQNDWNSLRVGLVKEKGIITSAYVGLKSSSLINSTYAYYLLNAYDLLKVFYGEGAGVRQSMTYKDLRRMPIIVPPLPEQQAIADFLDRKTAQIDTLIEKKQRQIDLLQEQRTALINHAVTKGLNPNVPMKDSGVEWLGKIPSHWDVLPLKRVVLKFVDYRGHTPIKTDSGILLVTAKNIRNGRLDFEKSKEYIAEDGYDSWMVRGMPEKGDVLVTTEAPLGATAQIEDENIALAQRLILLKANKDQMDNTFLKYYFLSQAGQHELYSQSTGSTAIGIKASKFYNINTIIPPLTEQQKISEHLVTEEARTLSLIKKIEEVIEYLQEYRTALISEAVTGKIDVRNLQ